MALKTFNYRERRHILPASRIGAALVLATMLSVVSPVASLNASAASCANAIACENQLAGAAPTDWQISADGDASIQGFATNISYNKGDTATFKINTPSSNYRIAIYRLGYYQGNGARLITNVNPSVPLPQKQPACLVTASLGLVDCGNWSASASWQIPANAVSGVYFAKLTRTDTLGSSWITFIVRDDSSTSDLLFQTADTTWQAYNDYGGYSFYTAPASSSAGRAYKLSYNRPFTTAGAKPESWLTNAEVPMIRWLEANGYDVSYTSGADTERRGNLLTNHRVFLSVGHDEYWSGTQRSNVEAARDKGVNLAFFSGNEAFWKTRWENSVDGSSTSYRTLVTYKETHANAVIDPMDPPTWTGTWRDPRFSPPADGGRPENRLTGTIFMVNGPEYDALTVPAADGRLRFWRNTAISSLGAGQTATVGAGCNCVLGYEWDSDLDNGSRPPGLFDLSHSTYQVSQKLTDYGSTYAAGQATHSLTLYRASSGALVFGAGTVNWSLGLDGTSDVMQSTPDRSIQQATVNLLADMGAQPSTLQSGLSVATKTADTSPPASQITSPSSSSSISAGTPVTISGTASDSGGGVVAGVEVSIDGGATWHPASGRESWTYRWTAGATGSVTIKSRAVDDSGNIETASAGVTVQVVPRTCPCSLWDPSAAPATASSGDTAAVEVGVRFSSDVAGSVTGIRFYKGTGNTGTHVGHLWATDGTMLGSVTFTSETASGWQQANFSSPISISAATTYVASYHTDAGNYAADAGYFSSSGVDAAPLHAPQGNNGVYAYGGSGFPNSSYQSTNYWVDVVVSTTPASSGPAVIAQSPAANATGVATTTTVTATFNESVSSSTIAFTLTDPSGASVPGSSSYNNANFVATFTPSSALATGTTYTANVSGATDSAGKVMSPTSWSFSTAGCPCTLFSRSSAPSIANSGDTSAIEVGMKFTADTAGSVTAIRFYKGSSNTGTHVGNLWSNSGQLLASVTFLSETSSGWQQASLASPVALTANTTYVVSYHTNTGNYSKDVNYFANGVDASPLHAPSSASSGGNGVYSSGANSAFPSSTYSATNYWVDVVFQTGPVSSPPIVISQNPAPSATRVAPTTSVTAQFNKPVTPSSIVFGLKDASGTAISSTTTWDSTSNTATFKPAAALAQGVTFTATVSGATDSSGAVMTPVSWSFSTYGCPCSLFASTATPAIANSGDATAVELGLKFTSDAPGTITAIRFYKGTNNTGVHTGHLWSASGTLLASVTFSNETASGWQSATLSAPVSISANTTYVVSYHTDAGNYSKDQGFFNNAYDLAPLHAPASTASSGNGVYVYGASAFPTSTYYATNYWVDVVFKTP